MPGTGEDTSSTTPRTYQLTFECVTLLLAWDRVVLQSGVIKVVGHHMCVHKEEDCLAIIKHSLYSWIKIGNLMHA